MSKLKRYLPFVMAMLLVSYPMAELVKQFRISAVRNVDDYTECVSISTSTWTLVPNSTDGNWTGRQGILLKNPSTNSSNIGVFWSTHTATPTLSTMSVIIELTPNDNFVSIVADDHIYFWLNSKNGSNGAENGCAGEWKQ